MSAHTAGRQKIVVAWDGARASATAFPVARVLAAQLAADIEVLHITGGDASRSAVDQALRETWGSGLGAYNLRIEAGGTVSRILASAEDPGVALVVLTTHVTSIDEGRHLGSVAEGVIARSRQPILLVRPEAAESPRELRRLLLPIDGTPTTSTALRPVMELAQRLGASVDLLYVAGSGSTAPGERGSIGAPRYVDQKQHEWPEWATEVAERLVATCASCPPDVPVEIFLAQGEAGSEIAHFARDRASDAIVLVRRSRLQPGRARILRAVLERTPCPVLIVGGPELASLSKPMDVRA